VPQEMGEGYYAVNERLKRAAAVKRRLRIDV
jgi:hypothetical protein